MKLALTIVLAVSLPLGGALPLAAEEPATPATTTTAAQQDSPLVAAAKRSKRLGKKPTYVITNETLKTTGANAHVTTTTNQNAIQMPRPLDPPRPTPEMAVARAQDVRNKQIAEQAEKDRKAKEEQQRKLQEDAAAYEDGYDGMRDDGAEFVGNNPPPPQF